MNKKWVSLFLFCIISIDASYVEVILALNKIVEKDKKIPGILEDDSVESTTVISHYIKKIQSYLSTIDEEVRLHYKETVNVILQYNNYIEKKEAFPFFEGDNKHFPHINNDRTQVDFFLRQICNSFEKSWKLKEIFTFKMLFYVHRNYQLQDELNNLKEKLSTLTQTLEIKNLGLTYLNSNLTIDNTALVAKIKNLKEQNSDLKQKLTDLEQKLTDEQKKCLEKFKVQEINHNDQLHILARLCNRNNKTIPPISFESLKSNIEELVKRLEKFEDTEKPLTDKPVRIPTIKKSPSPLMSFIGGMVISFLLLKGYSYCF